MPCTQSHTLNYSKKTKKENNQKCKIAGLALVPVVPIAPTFGINAGDRMQLDSSF